MVTQPENVVKIFQQTLAKLIEKKWKASKQADIILVQYKKFVSEVKHFHFDKCVSFRFGGDRLDSFPFQELDMKKKYEDLWITIKFLLTLTHGQA